MEMLRTGWIIEFCDDPIGTEPPWTRVEADTVDDSYVGVVSRLRAHVEGRPRTPFRLYHGATECYIPGEEVCARTPPPYRE
jgi:hypothetical protein